MYIYLRNKDTMSQSLPQPGGMTHNHMMPILFVIIWRATENVHS